ncbi:DUF4177 domain-containing protein [Intestinibacillus massiliensis]|nr:DUF4177 domain-containing protein [Intestinibacillus massiliensis]
MKRYVYKFVEIPAKGGLKTKPGEAFEACKQAILTEAAQGWRLKQVVTPFHEKMGLYGALGYQVIFEKEAGADEG